MGLKLMGAVATGALLAATAGPGGAAAQMSANDLLAGTRVSSGPIVAHLQDGDLDVFGAGSHVGRMVAFDEHAGTLLDSRPDGLFSVPVSSGAGAALTLYEVRDGQGEPVARVQASRAAPDSSLADLVSVTSVTSTALGVSASHVRGGWDVSLDGASVEMPGAGGVLDLAAPLGDTARVTLTGSTLHGAAQPTWLSQGLRLTKPPTYAEAQVLAGEDSSVSAASVVTNRVTQLFYDTWIPDQYVNAPDSGAIPYDCESGDGSDYWYGGDGIADQFNSSKIRTRALTSWAWANRSLGKFKRVTSTTRYIKRGDTFHYDSRRNAGDAGIVVENISNNGSTGRGAIQHAVGNPYCSSANNIDYRNTHAAYRTGGWDVSGKHDRMPHHKQYRYDERSDGTERYVAIFFHRLKDPKCLNAAYEATFCAGTEYQYSA